MHAVEVRRLAENWFRPRLYERLEIFHHAVQAKLGEFASRGLATSPPAYGHVEVLSGEEIELRGNLILEGYSRALGTAADAIPRELQQQVASDMEAAIAAESEEVRQSIQYVVNAIKPARVKDAAALRAPTLAKVAAECDLLCAKWNSGFASADAKRKPARSKAARPKRPTLIEKRVWQEAGSACVFCPENNVAALQVHHIDSDPANNDFDNLILVCATCHSKITFGVVTESEVITKKRQLKFAPQTADTATAKGRSKTVLSVDRTINTGTINQTVNTFAKGRTPRMHYPPDTIGSDAMRKNYVSYLVRRYFDFRKADLSYGSRRPFSPAEIHRSIEREFGAKTFFNLLSRFDELTAYLHARIEKTIQCKRNRSRGTSCYKSFAGYQREQMDGRE